MKKIIVLFICICNSANIIGQNETAKWYFGANAALDFMTNPPTVLNNSDMDNGGSSIADAAGNLLLYTNGLKVWNKQHQVMANGTGLIGGGGITAPLIIKHTGNPNLYYIFTSYATYFAAPPSTLTGLYYSIVDMSLSAGMGSVTVKNVSITNSPTLPELHATKHANDVDYWIMTHDYSYNTNNFKAYLLTSAGINTTAAVSSIGPIYGSLDVGTLKFSPTGQKLCIAMDVASVILYDFNRSTGLVGNSLVLRSDPIVGYFGCEFSPDGTKLYTGNNLNFSTIASRLTQWDLSAGTSSAIISSSVNLMYDTLIPRALQLAPNGKIYIASAAAQSLSVINNPDAAGVNCNFVSNGQLISAAVNATLNSYSNWILPNMITNTTNTPCVTQSINNPQSICAGNFYAISNKTHTMAGTYIDTLINVFNCDGISIVNTQLTVNNLPTLTVNSASSVCANQSLALTASGANTYTWNNSTVGNQYTTSPFTNTGNLTYTVQLQGTGTASCVATNIISLSVFVKACDVGIINNNLKYLEDNIEIFPNPASGNLNFSFSSPTPLNILSYNIINNLGQNVRENKIENNSAIVLISDLPPGLYQIQFKTQTGSLTKKFIKSN